MSKTTKITENITVKAEDIIDDLDRKVTIVQICFRNIHGLTINVPIAPLVKIDAEYNAVDRSVDYTDEDMRAMFDSFFVRNWEYNIKDK